MKNLSTSWTQATRNIFRALWDLAGALKTGEDYFITRMDNRDCAFPIKIKNPLLNKKENWKWSGAYPQSKEELEARQYFNNTEKDLTLHYDYNFKTKRIIKSRGNHFIPMWTPKDNIPYWVPAPTVKRVFVVAKAETKPGQFQSKKLTLQKAIAKTIIFLTYPLRFIPSYTRLNMEEYTCHMFRIGGVTRGLSWEFQIPKRFSFSN
jgi:hypothetical protein